MDYVKYDELIVDDSNKMRVNELYSLKEEAVVKTKIENPDRVSTKLESTLNNSL